MQAGHNPACGFIDQLYGTRAKFMHVVIFEDSNYNNFIR